MDLELDQSLLDFREEVRKFLADNLTDELRDGARRGTESIDHPDIAGPWQDILHAKGWLAYAWPEQYGGTGWSPVQRWIFERECGLAGAPILPGMGLKLLGPVLYEYGSPFQKEYFLPRILDRRHFWAQGFSEPSSGSDLASLRTVAVRSGDRYVVNGQKIWTTQAQFANWMFALVRTDRDCRPQAGISFLLIDMDSPGVEVRPIRSASLDHEVNEVFLSDVSVPVENLVGEEGQGWTIAKFLLKNERGSTAYAPLVLSRINAIRDAFPDLDPVTGARLDEVLQEARAFEVNELRSVMDRQEGREVGLRSYTSKLIVSELLQDCDEILLEAMGPEGAVLPDPGDRSQLQSDYAAARYLNGRAWSIFGGTSEIQLNIIAATLGIDGREVR